MNVIDLFGGVGGFSLGAHRAGFSVPLAIDLDKNLTSSRPSNFPNERILHADIAGLDPASVLRSVSLKEKEVCGIIGGPPCQGFSPIGNRNPADPRNRLVLDFFRFVKVIHPQFFVLENVPGILIEGSRKILDQGIQQVENNYQIVGPLLLDASNYGAPTRRRRVLVIGYGSGVDPLSEADIGGLEVSRVTTVFEAIHDLPSPDRASLRKDGEYCATYQKVPARGVRGDYARQARELPPAALGSKAVRAASRAGNITGFKPTIHTPAVHRRFDSLAQGTSDEISRCSRLAWDATCPTLRAGTGSDRGSYQAVRPVHPKEPRVITVREAARLQGFPDWFQFHPTQWHSFRMIGNSVSPVLASKILGLLRTRTGQ